MIGNHQGLHYVTGNGRAPGADLPGDPRPLFVEADEDEGKEAEEECYPGRKPPFLAVRRPAKAHDLEAVAEPIVVLLLRIAQAGVERANVVLEAV